MVPEGNMQPVGSTLSLNTKSVKCQPLTTQLPVFPWHQQFCKWTLLGYRFVMETGPTAFWAVFMPRTPWTRDVPGRLELHFFNFFFQFTFLANSPRPALATSSPCLRLAEATSLRVPKPLPIDCPTVGKDSCVIEGSYFSLECLFAYCRRLLSKAGVQ